MLYDRFDDMRAKTSRINLQEKTVTPTKNGIEVLPDTNYNGLSKVNVIGDNNLISDNIKKNITIFGVTGVLPSESEILDYYFTLNATTQKYKYSELTKRNPLINTSNITTMESMFENSTLNTIDLTDFITTSITNMSKLCKNSTLTSFLYNSTFNTSNVTTFAEMFMNCINLLSIDLSNLNTSNVTTMESMFNGCSSITSINLANMNVSNVTNMNNLFNNCTSLSSLNLKGWDFSNVSSSTDMFTNVPSNCAITVSSQEAKNFILSLRSDFTNITISADVLIAATSNGLFYSTNFGSSWNRSLSGECKNVTTNGSIFVCAKNNGIHYSYDGINWTNANVSCEKVCYGNNKFWGYNGNGYIYFSQDGINWDYLRNYQTPKVPNSITYGNGILALSANNGGVFYSTDDGTSWNTSTIGSNDTYINLTFVHDKFYLSSFDNGGYQLYSSNNCISWTNVFNIYQTFGSNNYNKAGAYGNGIYLLPIHATHTIYSSNGINFLSSVIGSTGATTTGVSDCIFANGKFYLYKKENSISKIFYSDDGITWSNNYSTTNIGDGVSLAFKPAS